MRLLRAKKELWSTQTTEKSRKFHGRRIAQCPSLRFSDANDPCDPFAGSSKFVLVDPIAGPRRLARSEDAHR
jgi:hypothetical protein